MTEQYITKEQRLEELLKDEALVASVLRGDPAIASAVRPPYSGPAPVWQLIYDVETYDAYQWVNAPPKPQSFGATKGWEGLSSPVRLALRRKSSGRPPVAGVFNGLLVPDEIWTILRASDPEGIVSIDVEFQDQELVGYRLVDFVRKQDIIDWSATNVRIRYMRAVDRWGIVSAGSIRGIRRDLDRDKIFYDSHVYIPPHIAKTLIATGYPGITFVDPETYITVS